MVRSLEQDRVELAARLVQQWADGMDDRYDRAEIGKARSLMRGVPAMLVSSGLLPTLGFLFSKSSSLLRSENKKPIEVSVGWWLGVRSYGVVTADSGSWSIERPPKDEDMIELLKSLAELPLGRYREAEGEALAFASWLKRIAEALLPAEQEVGGR
jgi:CRISPR type III-B/RAMP module-associated protein Cmr5